MRVDQNLNVLAKCNHISLKASTLGMIDEALNSGVEGTVEEEFEIVGRQRRRNTEGQQAKKARDVEKSESAASEQESGCLERLPCWLDGWLAKLREPFLPHVELRSSYTWQSWVFQRFKGNFENQTIISCFFKLDFIGPDSEPVLFTSPLAHILLLVLVHKVLVDKVLVRKVLFTQSPNLG